MPRTKLIKSVIDKLPLAEGRPIVYFDETLPGFGLRVGQTKKTFIAQRDIDGRTITKTIGTYGTWTPEQARVAAREKLFFLSQGIDPDEAIKKKRARNITLRILMEEFLSARKNLKPRTKIDYRRNLEFYLSDWMERPVTEITEEKFSKRYVYIGENNGKTVANNLRRILSSILNYAIASHKLFDRNPVHIIAATKTAYPINRRRNYIKPNQLKAWYEAVNNLPNRTYRDFFLFVLFTGLRRNEAASIKWEQVDFTERSFTILETKNGDVLTLPMSDFVYDLLQERRIIVKESPHVFPGPGAEGYLIEPKKGVDTVRKATGINFTVHDLRRTFVTYAESLDISSYALKAMMNHRLSDITGSYIILNVERLRKPVQSVATYIQEQINT